MQKGEELGARRAYRLMVCKFPIRHIVDVLAATCVDQFVTVDDG